MKRRSAPQSRLALHPTFTNPECTHARRQAMYWLARLLECRVPMDRHFFECLGWAMGGVQPLYDDFASALEKLGTPSATKALAYVQHRMDGDDDDKCFALEKALLAHSVARKTMGELVAAACKSPKAKAGYAPFVAAQKNLRRYFGLNEQAAKLCEYVFLQEEYVYLNSYFEGNLELYRPGNHAVLAKMLGLPAESLRQAIKDSVNMRILDWSAEHGECMTLASKGKPRLTAGAVL